MQDQALTIYMKVVTHDCGMVYMVPTWVPTYMHTCPVCGMKLREQQINEILGLQDRIRGFKGEITKLRGKAWEHGNTMDRECFSAREEYHASL